LHKIHRADNEIKEKMSSTDGMKTCTPVASWTDVFTSGDTGRRRQMTERVGCSRGLEEEATEVFKYTTDRNTEWTEAIEVDRTHRGRCWDSERYQPNRGKSEGGSSWESGMHPAVSGGRQ
jgi:hypothetical protein